MSYVNSVNASGGSPLTTASTDMATSGGGANCLIIAVLGVTATAISNVAVSDNASNAYLPLYNKRIGTDGFIAVFISPNPPSVTTTMTATATWGGGAGLTIFFVGYGLRSTVPVDTTAATLGTAATSQALSILYPSMSLCDALAVAVQTESTTNTTYTAGAGWVNRLPSTYAAIAQTIHDIDTSTSGSIQNVFSTAASVIEADFVVVLAPDP